MVSFQEMSVFLEPPGTWQLWEEAVSDTPQNCPPTGVISVEQPIAPWYREVVNTRVGWSAAQASCVAYFATENIEKRILHRTPLHAKVGQRFPPGSYREG
jgi:hypothetical protein